MAAVPVQLANSPCNPIWFVDEDPQANPIDNTLHPGMAHEVFTYPRGTVRKVYKYRAQTADPIELQFHGAGPINPLSLKLLKPIRRPGGWYLDQIFEWNGPQTVLVPTNYTYINGVQVVQGTNHFRISFAEVPDIEPGTYFLRVEAAYSSANNGFFDKIIRKISEPISVKDFHKGTIRLSCTNNTNDHETIFIQTNAMFAGRFPGAIHDFDPDSEDNIYTNQRGSRKQLFSRPGDSRTLVVGGDEGVPQWVKSFANYAMACDYKAIDSWEISKDENSEWAKIEASKSYPLGGISMTVRDADPIRRYKKIIQPSLVLFVAPGMPYFIHSVGTDNVLFASEIPVITAADEAALLTKLNIGVTNNGYKGYIYKDGIEYRYVNGPGENETVSQTVILPNAIRFSGGPGTVVAILRYTFAALVWSRGDIEVLGDGVVEDNYTGNRNFTSAHESLLFHNNSITRISLTGEIDTLTGRIPTNLEHYIVTFTKLQSFDLTHIAPAVNTLINFDIGSNEIGEVLNAEYFFDVPGLPTAFLSLDTVVMSYNKLNSQYVSDIISYIYSMLSISNVMNGFLALEQQTPPAPPDATAASTKAALIANYSWGVTTD